MKKIKFLLSQTSPTVLELKLIQNDCIQNVTITEPFGGTYLVHCADAFQSDACYSPQHQQVYRDSGTDLVYSTYFQKDDSSNFRLQVLDETVSNISQRLFNHYFEICIPNT